MSESATYRTRVLPPGTLVPFLLTAGTGGMVVAVLGAYAGVPLLATVPLLAVVCAVLVWRRVLDAEYQVDAEGIRERLTPRPGGPVRERRWAWGEVQSYTLSREPARSPVARNILLVRLPSYRIRLREPLEGEGRNAHARFVDRFVGFVGGDVRAAQASPGVDTPRHEMPHRQPLTSGEAPQLRRTLGNQPAYRPSRPARPPFLDRPVGRATAGLGALAIFGLALAAAVPGGMVGAWARPVLVLIPAGLWLAWRALRGSGDA